MATNEVPPPPPPPPSQHLIIKYPIAKQENYDVYIPGDGVINDPYRWMQKPKKEDTKKFLQSQLKFGENELKSIEENFSSAFKNKISPVLNVPRIKIPMRINDAYYQFLNPGTKHQDILVMRKQHTDFSLENLNIVLDLNHDGINASIGSEYTLIDYKFSNNGQYLAYVGAEKYSKGQHIFVINVEDSRRIDHLKVIDTNISWLNDNSGFFYSKFNNNKRHSIYYHKISQDQKRDILCFSLKTQKAEAHRFKSDLSFDGNYLFVYQISALYGNLLYLITEHKNDIKFYDKFTQIICKWGANYKYVINKKNFSIFLTNRKASNRQLIMIDLNDENLKCITNFKTVVRKSYCFIIDDAIGFNNDKILILYRVHYDMEKIIARDHFVIYKLNDNGTLMRLYKICPSKTAGYITHVHTNFYTNEVFYMMENFKNPGTIYYFQNNNEDPKSEKPKVKKLYQNQFPPSPFKLNEMKRKIINYKSYDSRPITISILYRNDKIENDNDFDDCFCLLTAYGGFNYVMRPYYDQYAIIFTELFDNSIYVIAHVRGDGELNDKWHRHGMKKLKTNAIKDFVTVSNGLVKNHYTSREKLIIRGIHCGGFVVAGSMNRKPDISRVAIIENGILDLMGPRKHRLFEQAIWLEFGMVCDPQNGAKYLLKYSPYHNVAWPIGIEKFYPATMVVITADSPKYIQDYQSLKYIAALQDELTVQMNNKSIPMILRAELKLDHGEKISRIVHEFMWMKHFLK